MLGKRGRRPPIKRTTSMTEFNFHLTNKQVSDANKYNYTASSLTPKPQRRNSADFVETCHFLRVCYLCKRRLLHSHDIYMYRGDSAFCSLDCRQQQMVQDERKEKCSLASKKDASANSAAGTAQGETVAAV